MRVEPDRVAKGQPAGDVQENSGGWFGSAGERGSVDVGAGVNSVLVNVKNWIVRIRFGRVGRRGLCRICGEW